jgi:hypothetical protein
MAGVDLITTCKSATVAGVALNVMIAQLFYPINTGKFSGSLWKEEDATLTVVL